MINSSRDMGVVLTACLNEALRQSPLIIERWRIELAEVVNKRALVSLQNIEKRHLRDAMLALQKHQLALRSGFVTAVNNAIVNQNQSAPNSHPGQSTGASVFASFDDLELMGDYQVQDKVDNARVLQTVAMESESGLAAFSARLSTVLGFEQVRVDKNPLRPEVFSRALLRSVQSVPVDNAIRTLWFTHGSVLMGQLVQGLYRTLNELLIEKGVAPAAYRVITKRGSNIAGQGSSTSGGSSGFGDLASSAFAPFDELPEELPTIEFPQKEAPRRELPTAAPSRTQQTVNRLRRLLVGENNGLPGKRAKPSESESPTHREFGHTLPAAMSVLDELAQHRSATPSVLGSLGGTTPLPIAQLRAQLKLQAKTLGQSVSIDVVGLMIEKMVNDTRLLEPVRRIIANAEPAFLRLAVSDPRFFSDKQHPARNLLEAITSESLAFASTSSPGFAEFLQDLQAVASRLTEEDATDTQHFFKLLTEFKKKVALRHSVSKKNHSLTEQGLRETEQRNELAQKIAVEITERSDFDCANSAIAEFLMGPWSQVLAKERLAVDADKTGANKAIFSLTLGELLWSLDAQKTATYPKRLAKLIPSILDRLQGGLLSIGSPLIKSKAFFEVLLITYQDALKSSGEPVVANAARSASAEAGETKIYLNGRFGTGDLAYGVSSWLSLLESEQPGSKKGVASSLDSRFVETQPFALTDLGEVPDTELEKSDSSTAKLRLGAWVDMIEDDKRVRAQLTWISLYKTLFVFTSEGGRTHSFGEPLLEFYMLQGMVKVISQEGVLAGALSQVQRDSRAQKR